MNPKDLRDPASEKRQRRYIIAAVVAVVVLAVATAGFAALQGRPADHHYRYEFSYTNPVWGPFVLKVPLPKDAEFQANWTFIGNATATVEETSLGRVLTLSGTGNVSAASYLDTWRDVPITYSTESSDVNGHPAAWVYYNSSGLTGAPHLNMSVREIDPVWTTEHFAIGDLVQGWSALAVREEIAHAP